jgi:DNA polymerase-3 subunit epsilon
MTYSEGGMLKRGNWRETNAGAIRRGPGSREVEMASPNFVVLDFETANSDRASVCAFGLVVVEEGMIAEEIKRLVRPRELYFDPYNTYIHGITEEDVENEPEFDELWPIIEDWLSMGPLVAHYASFDISVLRFALDQYEIPYPELAYSCTRLISKKVWPGLINYSLPTVVEHLAIGFEHHDPVEDASASATHRRKSPRGIVRAPADHWTASL